MTTVTLSCRARTAVRALADLGCRLCLGSQPCGPGTMSHVDRSASASDGEVVARRWRWVVVATAILIASAFIAALVWPRPLLDSIYGAEEDYRWVLDWLGWICLVGLAIIAARRWRHRRSGQ